MSSAAGTTERRRERVVKKAKQAIIRHMSYRERLRHYTDDKNELFYRIKNMTPAEIEQAHADLREKWQI